MADIRPRHDLTAAEVDDLEDRLYAYNVEATGYDDGAGLGFFVEEAGELIAAVAGYTWGGICEVRQLWVAASHRHKGLGAQLLEAAIAEASARGCAHLQLATYDFQAPAFYARHGFEIVADVPDKPLGHTEFVMRRVLG
ncbi:MAG: GNAT family N-acetyltransferase [Phenylobacterium sp.]